MTRYRWEEMAEQFAAKVGKRINAIHANASLKMRDSVVHGSSLTTAPGQPVDTGYLRSSWPANSGFIRPLFYRLATNVAYAPAIEEGNPMAYDPAGQDRPKDKESTLPPGGRSEVGGAHSVRLTRNNFDRILRQAVREEVRD